MKIADVEAVMLRGFEIHPDGPLRVWTLLGWERPLEIRFRYKASRGSAVAACLLANIYLGRRKICDLGVVCKIVVVNEVVREHGILAHGCGTRQPGKCCLTSSIGKKNGTDRFSSVEAAPLPSTKSKELILDNRAAACEAYGVSVEPSLIRCTASDCLIFGV